jgi:hypothetical protein
MDLMMSQTDIYSPFLKVAFPRVRDFSELVFDMMVRNALIIFISQYTMRILSPTEEDFAEFRKMVEPYRSKVKELF